MRAVVSDATTKILEKNENRSKIGQRSRSNVTINKGRIGFSISHISAKIYFF